MIKEILEIIFGKSKKQLKAELKETREGFDKVVAITEKYNKELSILKHENMKLKTELNDQNKLKKWYDHRLYRLQHKHTVELMRNFRSRALKEKLEVIEREAEARMIMLEKEVL